MFLLLMRKWLISVEVLAKIILLKANQRTPCMIRVCRNLVEKLADIPDLKRHE